MNVEHERENDTGGDWQSLTAQWREQPVSAIDLSALRVEARSRSRRLQLGLATEVLLTVVLVAYLGRAMLTPELPGRVLGLFAAVIVTLLGYQAWSLWIRRRQLRDQGLDARALLSLEIDRARTSIHYWRYGTWIGVLMIVALSAAVALMVLPHIDDARELERLIGGGVGGALAAVGCAVFAWWRGRHMRARITRLRALSDELGRD
ncbi:MAG: hypothetical protein ACREPE_01210 [Lysobacter sp.]